MNSKTKMKYTSEKGITLIALVITIIVLLILAGVTINMVLGDDGIIQQAQQAKQAQEEGEKVDEEAIGDAIKELSKYNMPKYNDVKDTTTNLAKENCTIDGKGISCNNPVIPKGFEVVTNEITGKEYPVEDGFVVKDEYGNEFVWVPVNEIVNTAQANRYTDDKVTLVYNKNDVSVEPNDEKGTTDHIQEEYDLMINSVKTYGGFYVGRYETGGFNTSRVVSKAGENPLSCINGNWYKQYSMQKELHANSDSVVSGMIYSCQWDTIMDWMSDVPNVLDSRNLYIYDSRGMGHYCYDENYELITEEDGETNTGAYSVKNVFDLAGNHFEWSQDGDGYGYRELRGGHCSYPGNDTPAIYTDANDPTSDESGSSRLQLYIK